MNGKALFGYVLSVISALGLAFSGLCTVTVAGLGLLGFVGSGFREGGEYLSAALMIGGIPMLIFWGLFVLGRRLVRLYGEPPKERPPPPRVERPRGPDDEDPWLSS